MEPEVIRELDVRVPMGVMFVLLGAVLTIYGLTTHGPYAQSLGVNINLWWGLVILAFGVLMLLLAWRGRRRHPRVGASASIRDTNDRARH